MLLNHILDLPITPSEETMLVAVKPIGGFFTSNEILTLHRLASTIPCDGKILEIGSYRGRSAAAMGHAIVGTAKQLYCLDLWNDYKGQGIQAGDETSFEVPTDFAVFEDFLNNTSFIGNQLRVLRGALEQFAEFLPNAYFDMIFIDAAHDYYNVFQDVLVSLTCLKPGGILCGHDYHTAGNGVTQAINDLLFSSLFVEEKGVHPHIWFARCEIPMADNFRGKMLQCMVREDYINALSFAEESYKLRGDAKVLEAITELKSFMKTGATN